jgi:hypothetical protein
MKAIDTKQSRQARLPCQPSWTDHFPCIMGGFDNDPYPYIFNQSWAECLVCLEEVGLSVFMEGYVSYSQCKQKMMSFRGAGKLGKNYITWGAS